MMRNSVKGLLLAGALVWSRCPVAQVQDASMLSVKVFQEGVVVLSTGNVLTGSLHFFPDRDVLKIICAPDSTYTLPAQLVRGFAAKDVPDQQRTGDTFMALLRTFRTFPLPAKKGAPLAWGFYEQLSRGEGPVLLLRREQTLGGGCGNYTSGRRCQRLTGSGRRRISHLLHQGENHAVPGPGHGPGARGRARGRAAQKPGCAHLFWPACAGAPRLCPPERFALHEKRARPILSGQLCQYTAGSSPVSTIRVGGFRRLMAEMKTGSLAAGRSLSAATTARRL